MNSSFSGIPTLTLWKSYSILPGKIRKAMTKRVDKVVEGYEILKRMNPPDSSLVIGLLKIAIACCNWLVDKERKKISGRRPAIQRMLENSINKAADLKKPELEILRIKLLSPPGQILDAIQKLPVKILLTQREHLAPFRGGKTLDPHQWTETIPVIDQHGIVRHLYGNYTLYHKILEPTIFECDHLQDYFHYAGKEVLTQEEAADFAEVSKAIFDKIMSGEIDIYKELQLLANDPATKHEAGVGSLLIKYFTDAKERKNIRLVAVRDGQEVIFQHYIWNTDNRENYTTGHDFIPGTTDCGDSYAASRLGAIYTAKYSDYYDKQERIQHSSYMGGKAVLCAGMIRVENGRLKHIDNGSGHYQPTTENLLTLLRRLDAKGFNLNEVTTKDLNNKHIYFKDMETKSQIQLAEELRKFSFNAKQFLESNGVVMVKEPSAQIPGHCRIRARVDRKPSPGQPPLAGHEEWKQGDYIKDAALTEILLPCL